MQNAPGMGQGWAKTPVQLTRGGSRMPPLLQRGSSLREILEQTSQQNAPPSNVTHEAAHIVRDSSLAAYDQTLEMLEALLQSSSSLSNALDLIGMKEDGDCDYCHGERVRKTIRMMIHTLGHGGVFCSECNKPLFEVIHTPEFKHVLGKQLRRDPSRTQRQKHITGEHSPLLRFDSISQANSFSNAGSFGKAVEQMIKHSYVLGKLSKADIDELIDPSTTMKVEQGQVLLEQNEKYDFMVGIVEGTVDIFVNKKWVGHVGSGRVLGELAMMSLLPCEYTAVAATDIVCIEIWHEFLLPILEESEEILKDCLAAFRSGFVERGKGAKRQQAGGPGSQQDASSPISSPLARGASMRDMFTKQGSKIGKNFGLELSPFASTKARKGGNWQLLKKAISSSLSSLEEGGMESSHEQPVKSPGLRLSEMKEKHPKDPRSHPSPPRAWATDGSRPQSSDFSLLGEVSGREGGQSRGQSMIDELQDEQDSTTGRGILAVAVASQNEVKVKSVTILPVKCSDRSHTVENPSLKNRIKPTRKPTTNNHENLRRHGRAKWRWKQGTTPLYIQSLEDELDSVPIFVETSKSKAERKRRKAKAEQEDKTAEQEGLRLRNDLPSILSHHISNTSACGIDFSEFPDQYILDQEPRMCATAQPGHQRKTQPRNDVCKKWQSGAEVGGCNSFELQPHHTADIRRAQTVGALPRQSRISTQQHGRPSQELVSPARGSTTTPSKRKPDKTDRCNTALGHVTPGDVLNRHRTPHKAISVSLGLNRSETPASSRPSVEFARNSSTMSGTGLRYYCTDEKSIEAGGDPFAFEILLRGPSTESVPENGHLHGSAHQPDHGLPHHRDLSGGGELLPAVEGRRLPTGEGVPTAHNPEPWGSHGHGDKVIWQHSTHPYDTRTHTRGHGREVATSMSSRRSQATPTFGYAVSSGQRKSRAMTGKGAQNHPQAFFSAFPVPVIRRPSMEISHETMT